MRTGSQRPGFFRCTTGRFAGTLFALLILFVLIPSIRNMSSDDAYASFLDKANQDTGSERAATSSTSVATKAVDTAVPSSLQKIEKYYTSEADEPFEPVSLKWSKSELPDEGAQITLNPTRGLLEVIERTDDK